MGKIMGTISSLIPLFCFTNGTSLTYNIISPSIVEHRFCIFSSVHEGALVQGLSVLSQWCVHFSAEVPKVLVNAFKVRHVILFSFFGTFLHFWETTHLPIP